MRAFILLIILTSIMYSQTVYEIPFASDGNEIKIEIFNDSAIQITDVKVSAIEKPEWVSISSEKNKIAELTPQENKIVKFNFDIEKEAKVLENTILKFQISGNNQTWNKEIEITVLPPDKFELNQNYPNPFNPTTTISYIVPAVASSFSLSQKVHLAIYDILGREVETLVNEEQKPGYYKLEWNGNYLASGMYIYQISLKGFNSKREVIRKKMLLIK